MSSICVDNVSLRFPVSAARGQRIASARDKSLVRDKQGRIIGVQGLKDVSFQCEDGERVALVGRNGSGKTTLLQTLAAIYWPDKGQVSVEGHLSAIVNVNLGLDPTATDDAISCRALAAGHTHDEIDDKRGDIEAFSELSDFLDLPVDTYSAGMRMRLSFAIATAFEPEIVVLDEWLSAGDEAFRKKTQTRMKRFVERSGILVLASHSQPLLRATCERAIWLESGEIVMDDPIHEILRAYSDAVAAANESSQSIG